MLLNVRTRYGDIFSRLIGSLFGTGMMRGVRVKARLGEARWRLKLDIEELFLDAWFGSLNGEMITFWGNREVNENLFHLFNFVDVINKIHSNLIEIA